MNIWIVDAFATKPFTGNPAAVTIVDDFPSDKDCHDIAAEMNLSETAFVKKIDKNHFHIRWFTPKVEVTLCGHATLAAAHILYQEKMVEGACIQFKSLTGELKVYQGDGNLTLDFPLQKTGPVLDKALFEQTLGIKIVNATQALDDLILEIDTEEALRKLVVSPEKMARLDYRGIVITAKGTDYDFVSRFFAPREGINEDPVTGSAHCKLAYYWQQKLDKSEFNAYQASERGGEIKLKINEDRVYITGKAITMLRGVFTFYAGLFESI